MSATCPVLVAARRDLQWQGRGQSSSATPGQIKACIQRFAWIQDVLRSAVGDGELALLQSGRCGSFEGRVLGLLQVRVGKTMSDILTTCPREELFAAVLYGWPPDLSFLDVVDAADAGPDAYDIVAEPYVRFGLNHQVGMHLFRLSATVEGALQCHTFLFRGRRLPMQSILDQWQCEAVIKTDRDTIIHKRGKSF